MQSKVSIAATAPEAQESTTAGNQHKGGAAEPALGAPSRAITKKTQLSRSNSLMSIAMDDTEDKNKKARRASFKKSVDPLDDGSLAAKGLQQFYDGDRWLIDPRRSRFAPRWDLVMLGAMLYTLLVTPFEVAYIDEGPCITPLFVVNRVVDAVFIFDMIVIFNTGYVDQLAGVFISSRSRIARRYFRSWFIVDVLAVLPFYLIAFLLAGSPDAPAFTCTSSGQILSDADNSASSQIGRGASSIRAVRLLRLLKLARLFKASRIIKQITQDILIQNFEMTYASLKASGLILILVVASHWLACLWAFVPSFIVNEPTWLTEFEDARTAENRRTGPYEFYIASLYWSVMTITSIGYGDLVPVHDIERALSCVYMIIAAGMWTYVIGTAAGIAATLSPNQVRYENTMDQLNFFMRDRQLPKEMRDTLRSYFENARQVHQLNSDGDLLSSMSPLLQGVVAVRANRPWLERVWFLRGIDGTREEREFIADLSMKLIVGAYIRHERVPLGMLHVLRRGMVVKLWRFLGQNAVWGEDMLLDDLSLACHSQAVALTYIEAFALDKPSFLAVGARYPEPMVRVRTKMKKLQVQRALIRYLSLQNGEKGARSFISREQAIGYSYAQPQEALDKRVERVIREALGTEADGRIARTRRAWAEVDGVMEQRTARSTLTSPPREPKAAEGGKEKVEGSAPANGSADSELSSSMDRLALAHADLRDGQRAIEKQLGEMAKALADLRRDMPGLGA